MVASSYEQFAAEHRAQHLHPFNRWCAVGNYLLVPAGVALLLRRPKPAAVLFGTSAAITAAGHIVEGNLPRNLEILVRHPIWAARADFAIANETIMRAVKS
jgi:hypothetical protein